ncbi:hypothetical protein RHMOL_Rhmol03G0011000 [Rhododendron molle]|uniref:Uncharacterized protein n=1 Tax=Rhododendron molle TaxID=49168 RepID=A0ACC0PBP5_RHOML|nr:hypothetical protein RHMOL_Rhmol03G0011000 [Rhododendron molle]
MAGGMVPVRFESLCKIRVSRNGRSPTAAGIWPERLPPPWTPPKRVRELMRLVVRSHSTTARRRGTGWGERGRGRGGERG